MPKTLDIEWKQKLADQIREAREAANLTQEELAKMLGLSRQMIINYEKNKGVPTVEILARMAVHLDKNFKINDMVIAVEQVSPRLRAMPKQLRLEFEKCEIFRGAVISIIPTEGQILISAKIPA